MNEDYLWDKSGEPDPEIERLENQLGRLRYKRPVKPLPLPATPRLSFRHSFSPVLAAAAALVLLLLAGGLWLGLRRSGSTEGENMAATGAAPEEKQVQQTVSSQRPTLESEPRDEKVLQSGSESGAIAQKPATPRKKLRQSFSGARQEVARHRETNISPRREQLALEGENAKAQLIMALHIASDKLNTVQKKIQANPGT